MLGMCTHARARAPGAGVAWLAPGKLAVVCERTGLVVEVNVGAATPPANDASWPRLWSAPEVGVLACERACVRSC